MKQIYPAFLAIFLLITVCVSCSDRVPVKPVVSVAYPPIVASLPMFVAENERLFEKADLVVNKTVFENSNDMVNSLLAGQTDILPAVSLIPILHLELQYPGRVRLFSHSRMRPEKAFDSIIISRESPIHTLGDLAGKKIGAFPGSSSANLFRAFMKKHGVNPDTLTIIPLGPTAQLSALESGAIDALFSYEPITTMALKKTACKRLYGSVYGDLLNPCPVGCSVVSREFESRHSGAASRAISVIDDSVRAIRSSPAKMKQLLTTFTKIDPAVTSDVNVVDVSTSDEVDVKNLQAFIDLLCEIGELPNSLDAKRLVSK